MKYCLTNDSLGWRNPNEVILRCVDSIEAQELMKELNSGICGGHFAARTTTHKIMRDGYFWLRLFADIHQFVMSYDERQMFLGCQR